MIKETYSYDDIPQFSARDKAYQLAPETFLDFLPYLPDLAGLQQAIEDRASFPIDRQLLIQVLRKQYKSLTLSKKQEENLSLLKDEATFTITTAHQPCLFTGPAYYVYKILSAIKLAQDLHNSCPGNRFVPVFVNGAEDHDLEEINHTSIFHKTITWDTTQSGPVGRFSLDNLENVLLEFEGILGQGDAAVQVIQLFREALQTASTYGEFTQVFLHGLFKDYGLLVLNMDDADCKRAFLPWIKKELAERKSETLVVDTQEKLNALGFKPQAHARSINLFYFTESGQRERILHEADTFTVSNTNLVWSKEEILQHAALFPEKFSPNVILRPLYQQAILPDIAFVGGGGEIAYWMERKSLFEASQLFFPVLLRRDSVFIVTSTIQKTISKLNLSFSDFLQEEDALIHRFIQEKELQDNTFEIEKQSIEDSWQKLADYMAGFDHSLKAYMEAEKSKVVKMLDHSQQKMFRSIKQSEEVQIQQIKSVKAKLFPGNGLQERIDNYFQFHVMDKDNNFLEKLLKQLDPLDKNCKVLFL